MDLRQPVIIYTDGACIGNPGPGGYGAVLRCGDRRQELSGGARRTTNNRMELLAAVAAMEALPGPSTITLYSDSRYLVDAMTRGRAVRWRANGWLLATRTQALNVDLWTRLLDLCTVHRVAFRWVKGHAGDAENERCDALAVAAARRPDLPPDAPYESGAAGRRRPPSLFD